jgi:hypothetical protein
MDLGEWQAHFIDTSSILRKGKGSDSRGVRYATMELPANVGAPMVIEDLEMLRHTAEEMEPRLVEGLLSIVEAYDLSLIQLSNEEGRRLRNLIESFRPVNTPSMRVDNQNRGGESIDQANYTTDKSYDGNKNYRR